MHELMHYMTCEPNIPPLHKKESPVLTERKKKKEKREKKIKKITEGEKNTPTHCTRAKDLTKVFTSIMHYSYCSCTSLSLKIRN